MVRSYAAVSAMALAFLLADTALAQVYHDTSGTIVPGVMPEPFPYTPRPPGQYGLALSTAQGLTAPAGARYAVICADGQALRYTTDGQTTPTASKGIYLANGLCVALVGQQTIANIRAITTTSGGTLDAEYFQ